MKARIKSTGEIVEVFDYRYGSKISSENFVVYTDSNGHAHFEKGVDFSEDFEELSEDEARNSDKWEQRRYEIAKSVASGLCANSNLDVRFKGNDENIVRYSIKITDLLIAELKKGNAL